MALVQDFDGVSLWRSASGTFFLVQTDFHPDTCGESWDRAVSTARLLNLEPASDDPDIQVGAADLYLLRDLVGPAPTVVPPQEAVSA